MSKHIKSEVGKGMTVDVRGNNVDQAMRRLKKKLSNDGIMQELRDRRYFESNTAKRLRDEAASRARHRKRIARDKNS